MSEFLSYTNILSDIKKFKRSGTYTGDDFNIYDSPSHKYFKILFYFGSNAEFINNDGVGSGLLAPTWELNEKETDRYKFYMSNSAWAYLKMNDENERAEKLKHFVTLLSDISSKSPWYFTSVSGIQEALDRKVTEDGKLDLTERKKLVINCLPDSFDNRISTLLELYRDITWSWVHKKEIIPSNLRKFDMAIYIFETPEYNWHNNTTINGVRNDFDPKYFDPAYKMIEFHNCEFNYNSIKSGWNELNNQTGFSPTYNIEISYDDCYEISYNDIMMRTIGDVILTDLLNSSSDNDYESKEQESIFSMEMELENRTYPYKGITTINNDNKNNKIIKTFGNLGERHGKQPEETIIKYKTEYKPGFISNAVGQVAGHLVTDVKSLFNRAILGNIYGLSLTAIKDQAKDLLGGNLIKTGMTVAQYAKKAKQNKKTKQPSGNIFKNDTIANNI